MKILNFRTHGNTSSSKCIQMLLIISEKHVHEMNTPIPHFYIVKLGFTGVYQILLLFIQNIDCGYLLESPQRGGSGSNMYLQSLF